MRKYILTVLILTTVLLFSSIPNTMASSESSSSDIKEPILLYEDELWAHWMKDENQNHIDDAIEFMELDDRIGILIDYYHHPTYVELEKLSNFDLSIRTVYTIFNTIYAENVAVSDVGKIAILPGVKDITYNGELPPLLDVSVRTIKARESTEYSPETVSDLGYLGSGITIAILDTGVDDGIQDTTLGGHPSLNDLDDNPETSDDPKWVCGNDYTRAIQYNGNDLNPNDEAGHGTSCAGIALGTGDGSGDGEYRGVAPQANLADVKVMSNVGGGSIYSITSGIQFCIENKDEFNIRVLSMSIGGPNSNGTGSIPEKVNQAVYQYGLVVVAGVGNDGLNRIPPAASANGAIAVGSIDDQNTVDRTDDTASSFSNLGPRNNGTIDIDDLKPDVVAPGESIMSPLQDSPGGSYIGRTGTSMSTPHVAGVVALMLEANPKLTPQRVKEILRETAWMPPGIEPSYPEIDPVYNTKWGWGIVDAYEAVRIALQEDDRPPIISDIDEHISGVTATISWLTHKEANSIIEYGKSPDQLDQTMSDLDNYVFNHSITLTDLEEDTEYYYKIKGYDKQGYGPGESPIQDFITEVLPDTKPPEITNIVVAHTSTETATIFWDTNELSDSSVEYGLTSEYGNVKSDFKLMLKHTITLFNLEPSTTYHFRINSTDASGNYNYSEDNNFSTDEEPDETPPIISGLKVKDITETTATFVWKTDEPSNIILRYNEDPNEDHKYWNDISDLDRYWYDHSMKITGLHPSTVYYYQLVSADPDGNVLIEGGESYKFNTTGPIDDIPPRIIDGPKVTILTDKTATIEWTTDEKSEGTVEYGSNYGSREPKDPSGVYVLVHNITLSDLIPSTEYQYRVRSKDKSPNANENVSGDYNFTTKPPADKKPPKILGPSLLEVGEHTATIIWTTNEVSDSELHYGTTPNYGSIEKDSSLVIEHIMVLKDLDSSTMYYYKVVSSDASGNSNHSGGHTFTTLDIPIPIEVDFLTLQNGQKVSGVITIEGRVSGGTGGIEWVKYKVDNETWQNLGSGSTFSIVLDTNRYAEGEHTLYVQARVGDMTMQEDVTFFVEHTTVDEEGTLLWILFIIIVVVLILAGLGISRSRSKRKAIPRPSDYLPPLPTYEASFSPNAFSPVETEGLRFLTEEEPSLFQETELEVSFIPETTILSEEPEISFTPDREPISFKISEEEFAPAIFDTVRCPKCKTMFNADISSKIVCPECNFSASLKK